MTYSTSSTPSVNHSVKFNPETNRYEIQINISYGIEKNSVPVIPPLKLNALSCLTTNDLAKLKPQPVSNCLNKGELKSDPIPSFGLSDFNLSELNKYQIPYYEPITKERIQNLVDSLKLLQKDCFI